MTQPANDWMVGAGDNNELAELAEGKNAVAIDWTHCENVRAKMPVMVKRILRRHGHPPDEQEKATQTVLGQGRCCAENGLWPERNTCELSSACR